VISPTIGCLYESRDIFIKTLRKDTLG